MTTEEVIRLCDPAYGCGHRIFNAAQRETMYTSRDDLMDGALAQVIGRAMDSAVNTSTTIQLMAVHNALASAGQDIADMQEALSARIREMRREDSL